MKKKLLLSFFAVMLVVPLVSSAAGFSDHWFNWLKKDQSAQTVSVTAKVDASTTYKKGDKADVILKVQEQLTILGIYNGDHSGLIGPKTEKAISAFQKSNGLAVTGMLDTGTANAILKMGGGQTLSFNCTPNTRPHIRVLTPNGGESYEVGDDMDIEWYLCNISAEQIQVAIRDSRFGTETEAGEIVINNLPGSTTNYSWEIPESSGQFSGGTIGGEEVYSIVVRADEGGQGKTDVSNNPFSIVGEGGEDCAEGTVIGYDTDGSPIYCGGGPGTGGCIDTGMDAVPPNNRNYSFTEWDPFVETMISFDDGDTAIFGDYRVTVGNYTICTLEAIQIVSLSNPQGLISQISVRDINTMEVLGTVSASDFYMNPDGAYYAWMNFAPGSYPLEANSIKRLHVYANVDTDTSSSFGGHAVAVGISGVNHAYGNGASVWPFPVFQKIVRIYNNNQ